MEGYNGNGYRLRSAHGDTIDPRQPLPVDTVEAQQKVSQSETITYNGKAAAGAITVNATEYKAIVSVEGDQVASFWGDVQNRVYEAFADKDPKKGLEWIVSAVETNGSATVSIYDPNRNLEEMFESLTTTVKRFVVKLTDNTGAELYGWVMGVAASSDVYTFDVMNARVAETQNWVGTLASFDHTNIAKAEIFKYTSSLVFGTGTTLTEEVACPREYSKNWENPMKAAEKLEDGQYFVDYMRSRIIGPKADTTASETITYNIWAATTGGSAGAATEVIIKDDGGDKADVLARTSGTEQPANTDNALVVYDVGGGAASVSSEYRATTNGVDGTAVYASASTLTLSGTPFTVNTEDLVYIKEVDATGNTAATFVNGSGGVHLEISSGTITKSGGSDFSANGVYEVGYNGQDKAYNAASDAEQQLLLNPESQNYVSDSLVDDTNLTAATHDYELVMDGYQDFSLSGKFIDADGTVTMKVYMMNDEDTTSGDWIQVYGYNDDLNTTTNSWTVTNGTLTFSISFNNCNYTNVKVEIVCSGATNTVIAKARRKAL